MGFNRRKMEARRAAAAEQERQNTRDRGAGSRRRQPPRCRVHGHQAKRMPMLFSLTITALSSEALVPLVRCPACIRHALSIFGGGSLTGLTVFEPSSCGKWLMASQI